MNNPQLIVAVRFSKIGKNYYFNANHIPDIHSGDFVVVETSRGWQLGEVTRILDESDPNIKTGIKKVDRRATPVDLVKRQELFNKQEKAILIYSKKLRELNLSGVKIITTEFSFDEHTLSILYTCEEDHVVNFEKLTALMKKEFPKMKIEFHRIGPRDVAKFYGGVGACGLEMRCCTKFLSDFQSISIKMAKVQEISLAPSDITGICERLRCCLNYEYKQYEAALGTMPRRNQRVITPRGEGKVVDLIPLQDIVIVDLPEVGERQFTTSEIQLIENNKMLDMTPKKVYASKPRKKKFHPRNQIN